MMYVWVQSCVVPEYWVPVVAVVTRVSTDSLVGGTVRGTGSAVGWSSRCRGFWAADCLMGPAGPPRVSPMICMPHTFHVNPSPNTRKPMLAHKIHTSPFQTILFTFYNTNIISICLIWFRAQILTNSAVEISFTHWRITNRRVINNAFVLNINKNVFVRHRSVKAKPNYSLFEYPRL